MQLDELRAKLVEMKNHLSQRQRQLLKEIKLKKCREASKDNTSVSSPIAPDPSAFVWPMTVLSFPSTL
jgi:hypothetical protein